MGVGIGWAGGWVGGGVNSTICRLSNQQSARAIVKYAVANWIRFLSMSNQNQTRAAAGRWAAQPAPMHASQRNTRAQQVRIAASRIICNSHMTVVFEYGENLLLQHRLHRGAGSAAVSGAATAKGQMRPDPRGAQIQLSMAG